LVALHESPPRPRSLQKSAPAALEAVCLRALARAPGDRYGSAKELADEVRRFLADEPIRARPTPALERLAKWSRRHPAGAALVLAGLAAQGTTTVSESQHIDRGYPWFAEVLRGLGADVSRVPDEG